MNEKMSDNWAEGLPLMAGDYFLGLYQPSPETVEYWEAVKRNELVLKWCSHCTKAFHPKRIVCTSCGASDLTWKPSTGRGKVYSMSEVHRAPSPAFAGSTPYTIGVVALDEGVYLLSRLIADPGPIAIDAPVHVDFQVLELGHRMPVFRVGTR